MKFIKNHLESGDQLGIILLCDIADSIDEEVYQNLLTKIVRLDFSRSENPLNERAIKDEKLDEVDLIISFVDEPNNYGQIAALIQNRPLLYR